MNNKRILSTALPVSRNTDTQTHRHTNTDTQTHRHTDTQKHRHTDTQTHRHTEMVPDDRGWAPWDSDPGFLIELHKSRGSAILQQRHIPMVRLDSA